MSEIATWSMIRSKISSFPAPTSGRGNECLTKSEIISMGGNGVEVSGSYGNQETVVLDNIGAVTWEYTLSASVSSLSFAGTGGTKSFTVTSTKQKKVNGVNSGSPVSVSYSNSVSGSGFSISGNSVTAKNNASSSSRSGTVTVTQAESGKKVTVSLAQDAGEVINHIRVRPQNAFMMRWDSDYPLASDLDITFIAYTAEGNQYPNLTFHAPQWSRDGVWDLSLFIPQRESLMAANIQAFSPMRDDEYSYYVTGG